MDQDEPAYAFPEGVVQRNVGGEMVLLHLGRQQYFALDTVGADIVTRLTTTSVDDAMAALTRDYDVELSVLESDVRALVTDLLAAGLMRRATDVE